MTTFAESHAQRVAEFEEVLRDLRIAVPDLNRDERIDRAVEALFRKWTAKADPAPFVVHTYRGGHEDPKERLASLRA